MSSKTTPITVLKATLIDIFNEAQNGIQFHKKEIKRLQDTLEEWSSKSFIDFFDTIFELIQHLMTILKREPATERLIEFIARFSVAMAHKHTKETDGESSSEEETDEDQILDNFTHLFLIKLTEFSQARDKAVRFRVTQIIAKTLNYARDDNTVRIHSTILDDVLESLLVQLFDRYALVRTQAALALSFFQDPTDPDCQITNSLSWSMENDSSSDVRKCIVLNLVPTSTTLARMISRTRDKSDAVRRCAYLVLSEKCTIRHLKIKQRLQLLRDGLQDRCGQVREACLRGLLRSWCVTLDGDIYDLLRRLDLESSTEVCETVLLSLFEDLQEEELLLSFKAMSVGTSSEEDTDKNESSSADQQAQDGTIPHTIPMDSLEPEVAFYWKCLCKYFKTRYEGSKDPNDLELLESVTPSLSQFCGYLSSCFDRFNLMPEDGGEESCDSHMTREFILSELCGIVSFLDFTDEVGRRQLGQLVYSLITSGRVPAGLVSSLLREQVAIWPQGSFRIEKLLEIIADIRYPGMSETNVTSETSLNNLSYLELKEDTGSLMKCLSVATELYGQLRMGKLSPSLRTLVESLLFPCIKNENPYIRDMAINALGKACLVDLDLARDHVLLFIQVSTVDHETVQATALKVVFDLLHLFGLEAFSQNGRGQQDGRGQEGDVSGMSEEQQTADGGNITTPTSPTSPAPSNEERVGQDEGAESETDKTTQKFLHILANFLDGESVLLKVVAVEGLSKLLLSGRVISMKLLTRLFILWYNPAHQDDAHTRAILGTFFTEYSTCGQEYRENIAECYIPLMKTVFEAPPTSPLCTIDVNNMTSFVLSLSAPVKPQEDSSHDSLSLSVANHLLSCDLQLCDAVWCRTLCRALSLMELTKTNKTNAYDLLTLLMKLCEGIKDKQSLRYLEKLKSLLRKVVPEDLSNPMTDVAPNNCDETTDKRDSDKENVDSAPPTPTSSSAHLHTTPFVSRPSKKQRTVRTKKATPSLKSTKGKTRSVVKTVKQGKVATANGEDSDDSLIGDHSPFLVTTKSRIGKSIPPSTS